MKFKIFALTTIVMSNFLAANAADKLVYPKAPSDNTVDDYFGIKVADPFRPLEDDMSAQTAAWVEAENAVTDAYLAQIPFRDQIRERLRMLNNFPKTSLSSRLYDGNYYFFQNDGLRNQSSLYRKATFDGEPEVFIDPNTLSDDGTVALTGIYMSPDGRYTAYTIARSGSDWNEIYVMDTKTRELLPDHLTWVKFTGAAWAGDGFYYSAYDRPVEGREVSEKNENHRIYYHKLGTPQSDDILAFEDKDHPLHFHSAYVPESQDWLVVYGGGEGNGSSLMMKNLVDPNAEWIVVEPTQNHDIGIIDIRDGKIFFLTDIDAPRRRVMVADVNAPQRENWRELIGQTDGVIKGVDFTNQYMVVIIEKDASDNIYLYDPATGTQLQQIQLPTYGSVGVSVNHRFPEVYYSFTSFTSPSSIYSYDPETRQSTLLSRPSINGVDLDDYVTEQVFYPSADGTKIPMFLTYKKGLKRDGNNPVLLYGYGGFNISLTPSFSASRMFWLENGGIYAMANLRGGSEYGEDWHQQGIKLNKLNVFNDFIAAAEYLIDQKWTNPELLTIQGGSNGGLLVGATTNMRPDLFKVAIPQVGVMDMLRYHLFTIGWNWANDYGTSADSPEMAAYLRGYSPVHNIKNDGTPYPAIMVTTADHDDRVVPAHSFKYAAALQAADTGSEPKLIRIDSKAGHGGGKPIGKAIDESADIYSFILFNIGRTPVK